MNTDKDITRLNITIPTWIASQLSKYVPEGKKSNFIADAVAKELERLTRLKALEEFAKMPPTHTTVEDAAQYIRELRSLEDNRSKRLGI